MIPKLHPYLYEPIHSFEPQLFSSNGYHIINEYFRIVELETSLLDGCDFGTLRNICRSRPVAPHLRPEVWQV